MDKYRFTIRPLTPEEGGGYLVEYPDIPGCMSDGGETVAEAIANGREALRDCLAVLGGGLDSGPSGATLVADQTRKSAVCLSLENVERKDYQHSTSGPAVLR